MNVTEDGVESLIPECLSTDLDAWARRVVARHFDPEKGSPYWLKRAAELSFDPREVTTYGQLRAFGPFPLADLRTVDPADLVPTAVPRPLAGRVWESGSTTGDPCRAFYTEPMLRLRAAWRRWAMRREGFQPGRTWLQATPSGPHLIGHSGWDLVQLYGATVYSVDFDPRWVKRQLRAGRLRAAQEYTDHVLEQTLGILSGQPIDYLVTTPALLQALIRRAPEEASRLSGVRMTGTHTTPAMWRTFTRAVGDGPLVIMYGNTFGNTVALPVADDGELMPHVPNYPQVTMRVVDQRDWTREVGYGEYGQVCMTVLHEDLFLPNILERDVAMRYDSGPEWPCDGVANVRPLHDLRTTPEGIY